MNKTDITKVLGLLKQNYQNFEVGQGRIELWHELLCDLPFDLVLAGVKKYMLDDSSSFPPAVGKIRGLCLEIAKPEFGLSAAEAWAEVEEAIRKFGWAREIDAIQTMSYLTRRTVKACNYQEICACKELGMMKSQFMKMYEQFKISEIKEKLVPPNMKSQLSEMRDKNIIPQITGQSESNKVNDDNPEKMCEVPRFFKDILGGFISSTDAGRREEKKTQIDGNREIFIKQLKNIQSSEK